MIGIRISGREWIPGTGMIGSNKKYPDQAQPENNVNKIQSCDMVMGLSHRAYPFQGSNKVCDKIPSKETRDTDLIISSCTHTLFDNPVSGKNKKGDNRIVKQAGGAGIVLVRQDFEFTKFSGRKLGKFHTISVSQKTEG